MNELLIEQVRQHEVLYNYALADYRDHKIRQEAWEEIGRELQITAEKAKEFWDKLRRCFCNAVNRRRDKKNGQLSKKPWKYEEQMSFIEPFFESRKSQGVVSDPASIYKPEPFFENKKNQGQGIINDPPSIFKPETNILDVELPDDDEVEENLNRLLEDNEEEQVEVELRKKIPVVRLQGIKRKKIVSKKSDPIYQILDIMKKQQSQNKNLLDNMDDTDLFFLSMSRITKQLPKVEQSNIKLILSNAVLQAEMKCNQTSAQENSNTS